MPGVRAFDHIQIAMPRGQERAARAFYGDLLGLRELPKPAALVQRGGLWFQCGALQFHVGVEDEFRPAKKAHPAFAVDDMEGLAKRLATSGFPVGDIEKLNACDRAFTEDPFGNRIELVQPQHENFAASDLGDRHQLHGVQPVLPVSDVRASANYFANILGFDIDFVAGDPPSHGRVKKGDGSFGQPIFIHLSRRTTTELLSLSELRIHVGRDLDGLYAAYRSNGAELVSMPTTQPWGLREFAVREPNGHLLRFCGEA